MADENPQSRAADAPRRRPMGMHKRTNTPRLTPDQARRQGEITNLALKLMGSSAAIAFLNAAHDSIGGRPLDVAIASDEGFERVVRAFGDAQLVG